MDNFQQALDARNDPVSCAFVVLMAHGLEGRLKGEDGQMVELENLFEVLNNKNCQALRGKPKVYIVQACRGGGGKAKNTAFVFLIQPNPRSRAPAKPWFATVSHDDLLSPSFSLTFLFLMFQNKGIPVKQ